jgi:hypothetical protein
MLVEMPLVATFSINIPIASGGVTPGNLHGYVEQVIFIPWRDAIPSPREVADYWGDVSSGIWDWLEDLFKDGDGKKGCK